MLFGVGELDTDAEAAADVDVDDVELFVEVPDGLGELDATEVADESVVDACETELLGVEVLGKGVIYEGRPADTTERVAGGGKATDCAEPKKNVDMGTPAGDCSIATEYTTVVSVEVDPVGCCTG